MRPPPDTGGVSSGTPEYLHLLDTAKAAYVKGTWEGYLAALTTGENNARRSIPSTKDFEGDRADRFHTWWTRSQADLEQVKTGIHTVIYALETFINDAYQVNQWLCQVEDLVRKNCHRFSGSAANNNIYGEFEYKGGSYYVNITGTTTTGSDLPVIDGDEIRSWVGQMREALLFADRAFQTVSDEANSCLSGAMSSFKSMKQFTHLGRGSVPGNNPLGWGDPTWQQLTGGNVFKMSAKGFTDNPFGTELMPEWYDPTTGQKVSHFIGKWAWVADVGAIVAAAFGQEEIAAGLVILVHGTKLGVDVGDKDWKEVPWDAADLVLDGDGVGDGVEKLTKAITYQARHAAKESVTPAVNGKLAEFVQGRIKEQIQESVTRDGETVKTIPGSAISQIAAEAEGELKVLQESGVK